MPSVPSASWLHKLTMLPEGLESHDHVRRVRQVRGKRRNNMRDKERIMYKGEKENGRRVAHPTVDMVHK